MQSESPIPSKPRVTLKDVALEAGVHISTAWRALSNETYVSEEKRTLIRKVATKLGYAPDPMLSALSSYRRSQRPPAYRSTLAWMNNFPTRREYHALDHLHAFYEGARAYAESKGFKLEEFWLQEKGLSAKRVRDVLLARNIRGLLMAPQPSANTQISIDLSAFACVTIGYSLADPRLHLAVNDQYSATMLSLRQLARMGHKRIGMATVSDTLKRTRHHFESPFLIFQNTLPASKRIPVFTVEGLSESRTIEPWRERFLKWREKYQPTAIICTFTEAMTWLSGAGLRVPQDVSVTTLSCMQQPGWAGIDQQEKVIGARAVELLISIFQAGERGVPDTPLRLLIEGKWRDGPTVRAIGDPAQELLSALE